jgi:hypothetical protein
LDLQVLGFAVNDHEQVFVLQMLWVLLLVQLVLVLQLVLQLLVQLVLQLVQLVLQLVLQLVQLVLQLVQPQQLSVLVEFHHVVHLQLEH